MRPPFPRGGVGGFWSFNELEMFVVILRGWLQVVIGHCQEGNKVKEVRIKDFFLSSFFLPSILLSLLSSVRGKEWERG